MITVFHRAYESVVGAGERAPRHLRIPVYVIGMLGAMTGAACMIAAGPLMTAAVWGRAALLVLTALALWFLSVSLMIGAMTAHFNAVQARESHARGGTQGVPHTLKI